MTSRVKTLLLAGSILVGALLVPGSSPADVSSPILNALLVGGGPDKEYNQVAIESNMRYVDSLLPASAPRRILFTDGRTDSANVLYNDSDPVLSPGETAFRLLFEPQRTGGAGKFRKTRLRTLNGPSLKPAIDAEFARLRALPGSDPLLLYFTGHGQQNENSDLDNNAFNLWNDGALTVRDLAKELARLPKDRGPIVLVMVQCFGGSFANLQFENGDPASGKAADLPLCGFFATTRERVAAGCTPELNEAEYHDFTGSFFAALTGKDRLGRPVHAADYDGDGIIEMDEAFVYAEINEPSIDVPVCTSDVFLRRFLPVPDDQIAGMPYVTIREWASPGQRAVLDALSADLHASGENRLKVALDAVHADISAGNGDGDSEDTAMTRQARRTFREAKAAMAYHFAGLRHRPGSESYAHARAQAVAYLVAHPEIGQALVDADNVIGDHDDANYQSQLRGARWLRLMRVAKTVVLERRLRDSGNAPLIARFEKLRALEHANPFADTKTALMQTGSRSRKY